jgi:uncharacterized protein (TIGR00251 family)
VAFEVEEKNDAVRFRIRVSPRAKRDQIGGEHGGALKVSVTAPPVDGAANAAIIKLLAKRLKVPKRAVTIVRGEGSRDKVIAITGMDVGAIREKLG